MIKNILLGVKGAHIWVFASPPGLPRQVLWTLMNSKTQILIWIFAASFYRLCLNKKLIRNVLIKYGYDTIQYAFVRTSWLSHKASRLPPGSLPFAVNRIGRLEWNTQKSILNHGFSHGCITNIFF
jgi:hypothetical protein